ncbi:MAG: serine acetyltransferase [Ferruginibacter sp.]
MSIIKAIFKALILFLNSIRLFPHYLFFKFGRNNAILDYDLKRWMLILYQKKYASGADFIRLMASHPEFRNLFYYRAGRFAALFSFLCPKMNTLFIETAEIGPGLFIQHGFATIIAARSLGKDCWVNQQVTIGFANRNDCPVLQDNVTVNAGAKVIGGVTVGSGSTIGANAVVVKNVPENCVVVGVPAYIVKRDGLKVREEL